MYQVGGSGMWSRVFAVPADIVDNHIRICGALSLKVLMVMLRHGRAFSPEELASILNQAVPDIRDALNYWSEHGIISSDIEGGNLEVAAPSEDEPPKIAEEPDKDLISPNLVLEADKPPDCAQPPPDDKERQRITRVGRSRPRMNTGDINDMAKSDPNIGSLLKEAQIALGRTLKTIESETIAAIYCYDGIQPDIILMMLQYCISIEKTSMSYLESLALDWIERGVDSHEKAEEQLLRLAGNHEAEKLVREIFGIYGRRITAKEMMFFEGWQKEMGFSTPMIKLAYERNIDSKGRLSFPYINGILSRWHRNGISTPEQAMKEMREPADKITPRKGAEEPKASYDLEKFDKVIKQSNIFD